jgi:chorismate dehydratase
VFRIGCVPFLNAKPLIAYFGTEEGKSLAQVLLAPPSQLARRVETGDVNVALASSFFALESSDFKAVNGIAIASQGEVQSVRLFSKVPFDTIETLALDQASMTSNHLCRIILNETYGAHPICRALPAHLPSMLAEADAAVLIGDAGMSANGDGLYVLDLGEAWFDLTSLPFVWALWIGLDGLTDDLAMLLGRAKRFGLENIELVAATEAERLGWPLSTCRSYLVEAMDYGFGLSHVEGLRRFGEYCVELGFIGRLKMPDLVGEASPTLPTSSR